MDPYDKRRSADVDIFPYGPADKHCPIKTGVLDTQPVLYPAALPPCVRA
jgi:hypothetical protein